MRNHVIVRAIADTRTVADGADGGAQLIVVRGDCGLMQWSLASAAEHPEVRIVWDKDKSRKPRIVCLQNVEVTGIEQNGERREVAV
jgi:hypothetical protein